ncbi:hypothetical protein [Pandoraea vervacti]|nr:hypothetical protein [Pandoraea vervacti]
MSIVWMTGVLAAQILGGSAVLSLLGVPHRIAVLVVTGAILIASQVGLKGLSAIFSTCLVSANIIIFYALVQARGLPVYLHSIPRFGHDVAQLPMIDSLTITFSILFVVVTGADYQQFVIAARRPLDAVVGSVIAGVALIATGFLPAAAVIAWAGAGYLSRLRDKAGVIPYIVASAVSHAGSAVSILALLAMLAAALGSGGAISRAIAAGLASVFAGPGTILGRASGLIWGRTRQIVFSFLGLTLALIVAMRGQAIVQAIVGLNIVYISSVGLLLFVQMSSRRPTLRVALATMIGGFVSSTIVYVCGIFRILTDHVDAISLATGLLFAAIPLLIAQIKPSPNTELQKTGAGTGR